MKELGLNQSALAKRMHVSRAYVSKVLSGKDVSFTFGTALRFARALQLDFSPELRERSKEKVARSKEEGESSKKNVRSGTEKVRNGKEEGVWETI